jgi:predicted TIM-barrel fold metal-dependent hydrolase
MLGLRFTFHTDVLAPLLTDGHMDWVWGEAERAGVPISLLAPHRLMHLIDAVAEHHPALKITLDHLSSPSGTKDAATFADLHKTLALAKRPNVSAKVSALPCYSTRSYPYRDLHDVIHRAYDAFGPQRLFWGTDLSRSPIPYRQHITMYTEEIPWLTSSDLEWIMGRGLCEWLGWAQTPNAERDVRVPPVAQH